jgi:O-antigen ligase
MIHYKRANLISFALVITLVLIALYFSLQLAGRDPASWDDAYGGIPSATLGNPNFVSSGFAILVVPVLASLFYQTRFGFKLRVAAIVVVGIIVFLIWKTQSIQGLLMVSFSSIALLLIRINENMANRLQNLIKSLTFLALLSVPLITFLGATGLAPKKGSATLLARFDYWRSAWNLILDNPLFGKGFDSFGNWYFYYRDQRAFIRSPGLFTDSTHNLLLELGVFGGVPLLICYLVLQALTLQRALKVISRTGNTHVKLLVVSWLAFHLQSAISPSGLALVALGFILTGVVYSAGNSSFTDTTSEMEAKQKKVRKTREKFVMRVATSVVAVTVSGVGIYVGAIPLVKDARFRDAIERGDGQQMIEIAQQRPVNFHLTLITSQVLKSNNYEDLALREARKLVDINPYEIRGWRKVFEYSTSPVERGEAIRKMRELDPRNTELLKTSP